jgi:hypothetical protein
MADGHAHLVAFVEDGDTAESGVEDEPDGSCDAAASLVPANGREGCVLEVALDPGTFDFAVFALVLLVAAAFATAVAQLRR